MDSGTPLMMRVRKWTDLASAVIAVLAFLPSPSSAQFLPGDLNEDRTVDLLDSSVLRRDLVGLAPGISQMCVPPPPDVGLCPVPFVLVGFGPAGEPVCRGPARITTIAPDIPLQRVRLGLDGLVPVLVFHNAEGLVIHRCGDGACTFGNTSIPVPTRPIDALGFAIGADGLPIILPQSLQLLHCGNKTCTAGNTTSDVSGGSFAVAGGIAIGSDDLPLIAFGNFRLAVTHCGNADCSVNATTFPIANSVSASSGVSPVVGSDGLPFVAVGGSAAGILALHCGNLGCTAGNELNELLPAVFVFEIAASIGADGFPLITYRSGGEVQVIHCADLSCSSHTTAAIDQPASRPSLAIGSDLLPSLAYVHSGLSELRYQHCSNELCSERRLNLTRTIDLDGGLAAPTHVTGPDGLPLIAYVSEELPDGTHELRVAHCDLLDCSGF